MKTNKAETTAMSLTKRELMLAVYSVRKEGLHMMSIADNSTDGVVARRLLKLASKLDSFVVADEE